MASSPRGGRCCELSSPAHLAQHFNIRDLSDMTEERVELCRIRLVKVRQERKQKQRFECEPPRLSSPDHLNICNKLDKHEQTMFTDRNDSREKIPAQ
jgi:hypothetical protein